MRFGVLGGQSCEIWVFVISTRIGIISNVWDRASISKALKFFFIPQIFVSFFSTNRHVSRIGRLPWNVFIYPRVGVFGNFRGYFATFWNLHFWQGQIFFVFLGKFMHLANFENLQMWQITIFFCISQRIGIFSNVWGHFSNFRNLQQLPSFFLRENFVALT